MTLCEIRNLIAENNITPDNIVPLLVEVETFSDIDLIKAVIKSDFNKDLKELISNSPEETVNLTVRRIVTYSNDSFDKILNGSQDLISYFNNHQDLINELHIDTLIPDINTYDYIDKLYHLLSGQQKLEIINIYYNLLSTTSKNGYNCFNSTNIENIILYNHYLWRQALYNVITYLFHKYETSLIPITDQLTDEQVEKISQQKSTYLTKVHTYLYRTIRNYLCDNDIELIKSIEKNDGQKILDYLNNNNTNTIPLTKMQDIISYNEIVEQLLVNTHINKNLYNAFNDEFMTLFFKSLHQLILPDVIDNIVIKRFDSMNFDEIYEKYLKHIVECNYDYFNNLFYTYADDYACEFDEFYDFIDEITPASRRKNLQHQVISALNTVLDMRIPEQVFNNREDLLLERIFDFLQMSDGNNEKLEKTNIREIDSYLNQLLGPGEQFESSDGNWIVQELMDMIDNNSNNNDKEKTQQQLQELAKATTLDIIETSESNVTSTIFNKIYNIVLNRLNDMYNSMLYHIHSY